MIGLEEEVDVVGLIVDLEFLLFDVEGLIEDLFFVIRIMRIWE